MANQVKKASFKESYRLQHLKTLFIYILGGKICFFKIILVLETLNVILICRNGFLNAFLHAACKICKNYIGCNAAKRKR